MKRNVFCIIAIAFLVTTVLFLLKDTSAQGPANCPPDKELCAKMLRFGQQAYVRGKYLDAKEYFRKAVQADPTSMNAWTYYDMTVVFALAEKVEKNSNLVLPDVSTRQEAAADSSSGAPPAPPEAAPAQKPKGGFKFKIVDDEGC
uniref:Tetratricopeptide repeat protein n=1 Tax=Candidatus Desulfatibia profunda TaxID=2841695 RepID=A0A8J6NWI3_9BACT|nr:hypothetical protein [Candidatus Desulfatibia profunda]